MCYFLFFGRFTTACHWPLCCGTFFLLLTGSFNVFVDIGPRYDCSNAPENNGTGRATRLSHYRNTVFHSLVCSAHSNNNHSSGWQRFLPKYCVVCRKCQVTRGTKLEHHEIRTGSEIILFVRVHAYEILLVFVTRKNSMLQRATPEDRALQE